MRKLMQLLRDDQPRMIEPTSSNPFPEIEEHRELLLVLAYTQLGKKLRRKLDPEDLVQEVMQRAYKHFPGFEAREDSGKIKAWLITIMGNVIKDQLKHFAADKRELSRERSAAIDLKQSAVGIEAFLAAEQTSPSMAASKKEELRRLYEGLEQISESAREVIVLKHLQNKTLQEIADSTGRTVPAVAGLLRRGLARLREQMA